MTTQDPRSRVEHRAPGGALNTAQLEPASNASDRPVCNACDVGHVERDELKTGDHWYGQGATRLRYVTARKDVRECWPTAIHSGEPPLLDLTVLRSNWNGRDELKMIPYVPASERRPYSWHWPDEGGTE